MLTLGFGLEYCFNPNPKLTSTITLYILWGDGDRDKLSDDREWRHGNFLWGLRIRGNKQNRVGKGK